MAFFRIDERFPFWTVLGDLFLLSFFVVVVGRVIVVIGDMSSEEFPARGVASLSSIGVEVPCWWLVVVTAADAGPGASSDVVGIWSLLVAGCSNRAAWCSLRFGCSVRAALAVWAFSAKQNFSILRLFLLYSPMVLQATMFMRRSFGSGGFWSFSEEIAMSLFRITVFLRLCVSMVIVYGSSLSTQRESLLCRDMLARLGFSAESNAVWSVMSSNFHPSR